MRTVALGMPPVHPLAGRGARGEGSCATLVESGLVCVRAWHSAASTSRSHRSQGDRHPAPAPAARRRVAGCPPACPPTPSRASPHPLPPPPPVARGRGRLGVHSAHSAALTKTLGACPAQAKRCRTLPAHALTARCACYAACCGAAGLAPEARPPLPVRACAASATPAPARRGAARKAVDVFSAQAGGA